MQVRVAQAFAQTAYTRTLRKPGHPLLVANAAWLQRTIGNQAAGRLLRQNTPASATVQRMVPWNNLLKTKTEENYGISLQGARSLVSKAGAPDLKPVELYTQIRDVTEDNSLVKTWVPNVIFMQKAQTQREKDDRKGERIPSEKVGLAGWQKDTLRQIEVFEGLLQQELEDPSVRTSGLGGRTPNLGILGLNDCSAWADRLRRLIAEEEFKARRLNQPKNASGPVNFDLGNRPEDMPDVGVGDTMLQRLFGPNVGSNYHAATVVARDTFTIVTLEAHVEKNLEAPVFHFYDGGLPGFVDANNEGEMYREQNEMGVGQVKRLELPTKKFYNDLSEMLQEYQHQLQEGPFNFNAQIALLRNFKEIVIKPTVIMKIGGEGVTIIEDYSK